jgi:hypothetical protein
MSAMVSAIMIREKGGEEKVEDEETRMNEEIGETSGASKPR